MRRDEAVVRMFSFKMNNDKLSQFYKEKPRGYEHEPMNRWIPPLPHLGSLTPPPLPAPTSRFILLLLRF